MGLSSALGLPLWTTEASSSVSRWEEELLAWKCLLHQAKLTFAFLSLARDKVQLHTQASWPDLVCPLVCSRSLLGYCCSLLYFCFFLSFCLFPELKREMHHQKNICTYMYIFLHKGVLLRVMQ